MIIDDVSARLLIPRTLRQLCTNAILVDGLGAALYLSSTAEEPLFSFETQVKLVSLLDITKLKVGYSQKNIGIISIAQKMCCVLSLALYFEFSRPWTLQCS